MKILYFNNFKYNIFNYPILNCYIILEFLKILIYDIIQYISYLEQFYGNYDNIDDLFSKSYLISVISLAFITFGLTKT